MPYEKPFNILRGKFDKVAYNIIGGRKDKDGESPLECAWREFCEETGVVNEHMQVNQEELDRLRSLMDQSPMLWVPAGKYALFMLDIVESGQWRFVIALPDLYRALPRRNRVRYIASLIHHSLAAGARSRVAALATEI